MKNIFFFTPSLIPKAFNPFPKNGLECWIHNTFFKLEKFSKELNFQLVNEIPDEGIIIFHKGHFPKDYIPRNSQFFICIQADYGRHQFAHYHICQNPYQLNLMNGSWRLLLDFFFPFTKTFFVQHWHQPNLYPRKESRYTLIRNIAYLGSRENIPKEVLRLTKEFCESKELNFHIIYDSTKWNDYSDFDVIISIRGFDSSKFYHKPYSKIVNALFAKCIVITGEESSSIYFKENFFPKLNLVKNEEEFVKVLEEIVSNPIDAFIETNKIYSDLQVELNEDRIIQEYFDVINRALNDFYEWKENTFLREAFLFSRKIQSPFKSKSSKTFFL